MSVASFADFQYRALSRDSSSDRVMPRDAVRVKAQATLRNLSGEAARSLGER